MRELYTTKLFRKDIKRAKRRGKDREKLQHIIDKLVSSEPLDKHNRPHGLSGYKFDCRECHIEPDWLLIWREDEGSVTLMRTGTHADLLE